MRHGLYLARIDAVSGLNESFTVSGHYRTADVCTFRKRCVNLFEDLSHNFKRITLVIAVVLVKQFLVFIDKGSLRCCRTCVYA